MVQMKQLKIPQSLIEAIEAEQRPREPYYQTITRLLAELALYRSLDPVLQDK